MAISLDTVPYPNNDSSAGTPTNSDGQAGSGQNTTSRNSKDRLEEGIELRYPLKSILDDTDYLEIQVKRYVPGSLTLNGTTTTLGDALENLYTPTNGTVDENKQYEIESVTLGKTANFQLPTAADSAQSNTQILKYIYLPIPEQLSDVSNISWESGTLNPVEAFGVMFGSEFVKNPRDAIAKAVGALAALGTNLGAESSKLRSAIVTALAGGAVGALGGNVSGSQLVSRATGQVFNPNLELLFDGPGLRKFTFTFDMFPRSRAEAKQVVNIIRYLKTSMSAKKNSQGNENIQGIFISAPDIFQLRYMKGGEPHPVLNKFKPAALVDMQVNYTGSNTYSTFYDGTPTHMQMSLTFTELVPIYAEDYQEIYNEYPTSVGY
jgi:hypothetical protein